MDEISKIVSVLISNTKETEFWKEHLKLLKICVKYKNYKKIIQSSEFQTHALEYCWLHYNYQGPISKKEDFEKKVKEILKNKLTSARQLRAHKNYLQALKKEQRRIEKKLALTTLEHYLFEAARVFLYLKSSRIEVRHRTQFIFDNIFREIGMRNNIPVSVFRYSARDEILSCLSGKKINLKKIQTRKRLLLRIIEGRKGRFVEPTNIKKVLKKTLFQEKLKKTDIMEGQIAFKGVVSGKVKIVNKIADIKKVKVGDILVSIATSPDVLPAMIKASAFVTDSGGITSHAAIIARELKKPCVIGTKLATKVLQDGDLVEVDAQRGIVRKIK